MIKLFEEYNEYYTEVSKDVSYFFSKKNLVPFDQKEVLLIKDYINDLYGSNEIIMLTSFFDHQLSLSKKPIQMNTGDHNNIYSVVLSITELSGDEEFDICLQKLPDEWYILGYGITDSIWYKCDQLEGVYKLLKDKLKI